MKRGFSEIGLDNIAREFLHLKSRVDAIGEKFFLMAGTLLGAVRDHNFIEHDRDVDLGVMDEFGLIRIYECLGKFYDEAIFLDKVEAGKIVVLKKYFGEYELPFEFQCHYRQKDVVFYNREMDETWKCYETHVEYPAYLFKEFTQIPFLGSPFLVPTPPQKWLDLFYGTEWSVQKDYTDWRYNCPIFMSGYMTERPYGKS